MKWCYTSILGGFRLSRDRSSALSRLCQHHTSPVATADPTAEDWKMRRACFLKRWFAGTSLGPGGGCLGAEERGMIQTWTCGCGGAGERGRECDYRLEDNAEGKYSLGINT